MILARTIGFFTAMPAPQRMLIALALIASAILGAALFSQYFMGLYPCDLCIKQRVPYAIIIVLGLGGGLLLKSRAKARGVGWVCFLLLLVEAGIAWYHAGVEKGIFKGPDACSGGSAPGDSLEELRRQIMEAPLVSCSQAMTEWMGLSMAAWNGIIASLLCIMVLVLLVSIRGMSR